jgi:hypothetical protein
LKVCPPRVATGAASGAQTNMMRPWVAAPRQVRLPPDNLVDSRSGVALHYVVPSSGPRDARRPSGLRPPRRGRPAARKPPALGSHQCRRRRARPPVTPLGQADRGHRGDLVSREPWSDHADDHAVAHLAGGPLLSPNSRHNTGHQPPASPLSICTVTPANASVSDLRVVLTCAPLRAAISRAQRNG